MGRDHLGNGGFY